MQIYAPAPKGSPPNENVFIEQFFGTTYRGYFVDIGAHDGCTCSNTYPLWKRGWSGLFVEPDPITFNQLVATYRGKDRASLLNAAVCLSDGPVEFMVHSDPERSGWHSLSSEWVSTWEPDKVRKITVDGIRFSSLKLTASIDFLSIDTEGYDVTIVKSIPESIRPRLIMCEVDKHLARENLEKEMARRRYKFVWGTYLNSAYAAF